MDGKQDNQDRQQKPLTRREAIKMLALGAAGAITSLTLGRDAFAWDNRYYSNPYLSVYSPPYYGSYAYSSSSYSSSSGYLSSYRTSGYSYSSSGGYSSSYYNYSSYSSYRSYSSYSSLYSSYSSLYSSYSPYSSHNSNAPGQSRIGEAYGGGIIFYVDGSGQHGLIVAKEDINKKYKDRWNGEKYDSRFRWCTGRSEGDVSREDYAYGDIGTYTWIGAGGINTQQILLRYPVSDYPNSAAAVVSAYRGGGYSDWFLPSRDELYELCKQYKKSVFGGFAPSHYWSSSEYSAVVAWNQNIGNGSQFVDNKVNEWRVRPVRAF